MSNVYHPVICKFEEILNFEVRIFVIVYFQLRKKEFDWSIFFCWTNKRFIFSVKKQKNICTSKFEILSKLANHRMTCQEQDVKSSHFIRSRILFQLYCPDYLPLYIFRFKLNLKNLSIFNRIFLRFKVHRLLT